MKARLDKALFSGSIKLTCTDSEHTTCEFDGSCDAAGLGMVLGIAARSHMQKIPADMKDTEFRALLAAFVMSTADPTPLELKEGSIDMVLVGGGNEVPA